MSAIAIPRVAGGRWLLAPLVLLALSLGALTASAQATTCNGQVYGEFCETAREHAEFQAFTACPFGAAPQLLCSWAQTSAKEVWPSKKVKEKWEVERERKPPELPSEIKAGNATILLREPVTLQGGIAVGEESESWVGASGAPTISAPPELVASLTHDVNTSLLSASELNRFNYFVKVAKETKVFAEIELAGPASAIQVSAGNLLSESGTAFSFPVKLHLISPFVGPECYVGSDSSPVVTELTTGTSGTLRGKNGSTIGSNKSGGVLTVNTDTLVNDTFASPGVEGCGVGGGADAAIDSALALPSPAGANSVVLNGTLRLGESEKDKEGLEGKI